MSTRCFIGIRASNDEIVGIYNHHDGYPSWTGDVLVNNFNTARKAWELVGLGNRSTIYPNLEDASSYEGEGEVPRIEKDVDAIFEHQGDFEYAYVFQNGAWYYATWRNHELKLLTAEVIEED